MRGAQLRQLGDVAEHDAVRAVAVATAGRRAADHRVVVVRRDLAGEHVLAGVLVATVADEALLVAVVDDRLAAQREHQRVGEVDLGAASR